MSSVTVCYRLFDWLSLFTMGEDLADKVDDFICAWDKVVGTDIDTLVVLILGEQHSHISCCPVSMLPCRLAGLWRRDIHCVSPGVLHPGAGGQLLHGPAPLHPPVQGELKPRTDPSLPTRGHSQDPGPAAPDL